MLNVNIEFKADIFTFKAMVAYSCVQNKSGIDG